MDDLQFQIEEQKKTIEKLKSQLEALKVRKNSLYFVIGGFIVLELGSRAKEFIDPFFELLAAVICAILVIYGLYNFFAVKVE